MLDEHTQKLFDQKGAQCERLKRLLRRRRERVSRILRASKERERKATEQATRATLIAMGEDE